MAAVRTHELKLRLSSDELAAVRARAGDVPLAAWLRQLAVEGVAPPPRRRLVLERPLHPQAAELVRVAAIAGNQLRRVADSLSERQMQAELLLLELTQIKTALWRCLERI